MQPARALQLTRGLAHRPMAGLRAGCTTVAVSKTGNMLGLDEAEVRALTADELAARLQRIEADFRGLGAHHVIESVADLPALLARI